jgi:DNA-binding beta-propeller fold protein YncE
MPASAASPRPSSARARATRRARRPAGSGGQIRAWAPRRALSPVAAVAGCLALLVTVLVTGPGAVGAAAASPANAAAHYVTLSGAPGMPVLDPANGTIYVPVQCAQSYCANNAPGKAVDIVSADTCNATDGSGCHMVATAPGDVPLGAAIDPTTSTVYVMNSPPNGNSTIGVLDGRTCNATVTSGCRRVVATIAFGSNAFIVAGAVDAATRTLYVASPSHGVYVVDIASCNDIVTTGCGQHPGLVKDDGGPGQIDIDTATNTIYVADQGNPNLSSSNGSTVTVIDGNTCDARDNSGCGAAQSTVTVGVGVSAVAVDEANDTVYVANANDGTVSVIDGKRCSSLSVSGCHGTPHEVPTGAGTADVVVDAQDHTVFALNSNDDTLSSIDAETCDGATPSGCPALAPSQREAPEVGPGANQNDVIVTPGNQTAYAVNEGGQNVLIVSGAGGCTALDHSGCRVLAPSVPEAGVFATLDPATGTLYVSSADLPQVDVINASRCDPARLSGCVPVGKIPTDGPTEVGSVDDATHTLYVADATSNSVAVIDTTTCNATDVSGCASHHASIRVGGQSPFTPLLDKDTGSLYVPYGATTDKVAVIGTQACNAEIASGCGGPRGMIDVPEGTYSLALDPATDTVYGAVSGNPFASGNDVVVINGADCVGDMASCGKVAATISLGAVRPVVGGPAGPFGLAVDDATHTLYVLDNHDGNLPGTVTILSTAACNGFVTSGCAGKFPTVFVGRSPRLAGLDARTGLLYVTNHGSADVSVLNTARCNAEAPAGCAAPVPEVSVGSQPNGLAIDELTGTAYVLSLGTGTMSLLRGNA